MKQWRLVNRDRLREYKKQYEFDNKEIIKEKKDQYMKEYYLKNQEMIKEKNKQYRKKNQDSVKEYNKQYRVENKEKMKEYNKQYYIENQEEIKERKNVWSQNHQLIFLGKLITLDNIDRTLSCMCCRFQGTTNLHHLKYDLNNPLKYTIELCDRCHLLWHREENYLRFGKKGILPAKELMIENTMELEEGIGGDGL